MESIKAILAEFEEHPELFPKKEVQDSEGESDISEEEYSPAPSPASPPLPTIADVSPVKNFEPAPPTQDKMAFVKDTLLNIWGITKKTEDLALAKLRTQTVMLHKKFSSEPNLTRKPEEEGTPSQYFSTSSRNLLDPTSPLKLKIPHVTGRRFSTSTTLEFKGQKVRNALDVV